MDELQYEFDVEFILLKNLPGIKKGTRYRRTNIRSNSTFVPVDENDRCIGWPMPDSVMRHHTKWFQVVKPLESRKQDIKI